MPAVHGFFTFFIPAFFIEKAFGQVGAASVSGEEKSQCRTAAVAVSEESALCAFLIFLAEFVQIFAYLGHIIAVAE